MQEYRYRLWGVLPKINGELVPPPIYRVDVFDAIQLTSEFLEVPNLNNPAYVLRSRVPAAGIDRLACGQLVFTPLRAHRIEAPEHSNTVVFLLAYATMRFSEIIPNLPEWLDKPFYLRPNIIRTLRQAKGWTMEQAGLSLGRAYTHPAQSWAAYESGRISSPSAYAIHAIAKSLGVHPRRLIMAPVPEMLPGMPNEARPRYQPTAEDEKAYIPELGPSRVREDVA